MNNVLQMKPTEETMNEMSKEFGIFVGFYNRLNGTSISVRRATKIPQLVKLFHNSKNLLVYAHSTLEAKQVDFNSKSTKVKSYEACNLPKLCNEIFTFIKNNPGYSRYEIAQSLGRRVSTVCGIAKILLDSGLIEVSGSTVDEHSKRVVETLSEVAS
jgi:hypothetical protein